MRYSQRLSSLSGNDSKKEAVTSARPRIAPKRRAGRVSRSRRMSGTDRRRASGDDHFLSVFGAFHKTRQLRLSYS